VNNFVDRIEAVARACVPHAKKQRRQRCVDFFRDGLHKGCRGDRPWSDRRVLIGHLLLGTLLPLWLVLSGPVRASGVENVNSMDQAAAVMLDLEATTAAEMKACQAKGPDESFFYQIANYVWHGENYGLLAAANNALSAEKARAMQPELTAHANAVTHGIDADPSVCTERARVAARGIKDVRENFPKTYTYLSDVYSKSSDLVAAKQQNDIEVGCMKGMFNAGVKDFARSLGVCQCTREAVYGALTADERKDFFAHSKDRDYANHAPWAPRLRERGNACIAKLPGH
jgi:hypothetical protein